MTLIKILVVDDDADVLDMVKTMLENAGMVPTCISNPEKLIPQIEAILPDIIIMDIYLRVADGRELCHHLRASAAYSTIPVLLYSAGNITRESLQQSMASGFIAKPFDMDHLLKTIHLLANK